MKNKTLKEYLQYEFTQGDLRAFLIHFEGFEKLAFDFNLTEEQLYKIAVLELT